MLVPIWRHALVGFAALTFAGAAAAQADRRQQQEQTPPGRTEAVQLKSDLRDALQKLHAANQAEAQLGAMAQSSAQTDDVKELAEKMVTDQQNNDRQLTRLAEKMGVDLSGSAYQKAQSNHEKAVDKLSDKTGLDFDRAYMDLMVKEHQKDAKELSRAADSAKKENQTELFNFFDQTHSTVQQHLLLAKQTQAIVKSQRVGRRAP